VRDPSRAQLFYVPIWTVTSAVVGACNGTTHAGRMVAARDALLASPWWRRFYGRANLLPELAAENGWNRTALPAAPRLPASCGRAAALARKLATS